MLEQLIGDARYAIRSLIRRPGFALTVVLTLAIGIGANTAMFTVVDGVLLTRLPYAEPDRLVLAYGSFSLNSFASVSPPDFLDYREQNDVFESFAAATSFQPTYTVTGGDRPERLDGRAVSAGFFGTLGVDPALGRDFTRDDERTAESTVVVLSHGTWVRRFGGSPDALGQSLTLDDRLFTVIGVMPPGFDYPAGTEIWVPIPFDSEDASVRRFHFLRPIGRLADGVDLATAQAQMDGIALQLEQAYPDSNTTWKLNMMPLHSALVGSARTPLLILLGAAGLVLLIGCANVASLLLARSSTREREIAMRKALGAGRGRLVAQLLTESLVLASLGGAVGLLFAIQGVQALVALAPAGLPRLDQIAVDARMFACAGAIALVTAVVFGLAPALHAAAGSIAETLKSTGWSVQTRSGARMRSAMVVAQVGLSLVLLVGAGLLIRTLWRLQQVDPGFVHDGLLRATVHGPEDDEPAAQFFEALLEQAAGLPGVESAAAIDILPLSGGANDTYVWVEGQQPESGQFQTAQLRTVTPDYFGTMKIPVLRGRSFEHSDRPGAPMVVAINRTMAQTYFGDGDPIGKRLVVDLGEERVVDIVAVVGDTRDFSLGRAPTDTMYLPHGQAPSSGMRVVLRAAGDPSRLAAALQDTVQRIDPDVPVSDIGTVSEYVQAGTAQPRFRALLLGGFALTALLLSAVGLYGVLSWFVTQRTREVGIRMALGARQGDVLRWVVSRGMLLTGIGLGVGVAGALALTWLMRGILFGVGAADPWTFVAVVALLGTIALATCWIPARRATRVDPIVALRCD